MQRKAQGASLQLWIKKNGKPANQGSLWRVEFVEIVNFVAGYAAAC